MPVISCPNGHRLQVSDRQVGQSIKCPTCQASFVANSEEQSLEFGESVRGVATSSDGVKLPESSYISSMINAFVGKPLLFIGLVLVILGRGCDTTGMRSVSRTDAQYRQVKVPFVAGEPIGDTHQELRQVATKLAPELAEVEIVSASTALYQDKRQEVLTWALQEAKKGTLPEPMRGAGRSSDLAEALTLPSGQVVPAAGASAWLIARHDRALRLGLQPYPDCEAALMILRHDLRALSLWAAHARVWLDAPYTHDGEVCLLPSFVSELKALAAT